jgi:hypothetical protein
MHLLMNHSLPGVNAGYITRAKLVGTHLRQAQQAISSTIFDTITNDTSRKPVWPMVSATRILRDELPARVHMQRGNGTQCCGRNMAVFRQPRSECLPDRRISRCSSRRNGLSIALTCSNQDGRSSGPMPLSRRFSGFQSIANTGLSGGSDLHASRAWL